MQTEGQSSGSTENPIRSFGSAAPKVEEAREGSAAGDAEEGKAKPERRLTLEVYHASLIALESKKAGFAADEDSQDEDALDVEDELVLDAVSKAAANLQMGFVRKVSASRGPRSPLLGATGV